MRNVIIPAQITNVEDRIAGNLSLSQILILMIPVFGTALIYTLLPSKMQLNSYKLIMILTTTIISLALSIRIKKTIVAKWLILIAIYQLRAKYFLFNKNSLYQRQISEKNISKNKALILKKSNQNIDVKRQEIKESELVKLEYLINQKKLALRYQVRCR